MYKQVWLESERNIVVKGRSGLLSWAVKWAWVDWSGQGSCRQLWEFWLWVTRRAASFYRIASQGIVTLRVLEWALCVNGLALCQGQGSLTLYSWFKSHLKKSETSDLSSSINCAWSMKKISIRKIKVKISTYLYLRPPLLSGWLWWLT